MYYFLYIVSYNPLTVLVGEPAVIREGLRLTIDCGQLIDGMISSGAVNPTVTWYRDGTSLSNGSAANVFVSQDKRQCIISSTLLAAGGQAGNSGNYTCEVCDGNSCVNDNTESVVCGEQNMFAGNM